MRPTTKTTAVPALLAAAALLVTPPAAATAKPGKGGKLKPKTFRLTVSGEQLTTWNFIKRRQPSCDWPVQENGRQYLRFSTANYGETANPKVKVKPKKGGGVTLDFVRDDIGLIATANMLRNYRVLYSQMSECPPGGGPFGGEDPPPDAIGTNRCKELGELDMFLGSSIGEVENPSYPTGIPDDPDDGKDRFYFAADPYWSLNDSYHSLPALCAEHGEGGADIGITESQGEWAGGVIPAGTTFSAKKLLAGKKRKVKIELGRTVSYPNKVQTWGGPEDTTGKTRMDVTFTFERTRR